MDRPDESPPRSLREARRGSIPFSMQLEAHPSLVQPQPQSQQQPPQSTATANLPPFTRRRSSPLSSGVHSQHVSATISQPLSSEHPQYHSHMDDPQDYVRLTTSSQRRETPPSVTHPRTIQRVPPPTLVESDNRYNANLRDEWSMADQYLEMDQTQNSFSTNEPNLGSGLIGNSPNQGVNNATASMPKGPIIEREREGKSREQKELSRDIDNIPSGGSAASGPRRSDSLRRSTRPPQPQTQSIQTKNVTPPPSHNQPNQPPGQSQRPAFYSDRSSQSLSRSSPTYVSSGGNSNSSQVDPQLYAQSQQQPSPTHHRDNSPQMRYEERTQPAKAKTPDRSLPVQEENEAEEDVPVMAPIDRERTRQRDLDNETIKPRSLNHRLPTPQFSKSPMMPGDRIQPTTGTTSEDLSTTVHDDEYDAHQDAFDERNGRSSRAGHRYEEEEEDHHRDPHGKASEHIDQTNLVQPDIEEQEDTETYTPRSPPANLPQNIPHLHNTSTNNHNNPNPNPNNNAHAERVMYHNNPSLSHLHFRPRTASSDAGGMPNLDAALLQPLASEYNRARGVALDGSYSQAHSFGPHTTLPQRVPTIEEIRALADGALHRQTVRPGAPIPPTPPNNGTYPILSYLQPSVSPPPPRATPYPFSYPYQHIMQQSPDPNQMLQQLLGMQTDSTFSPSSTPYPAYDYSPFLPEHFRRHDPTMSMRSSPSHMPVNLPFFPIRNNKPTPKKRLKRTQSHRELARTLPPRGESTEPRETTPEPLDSEDEEDMDDEYHDIVSPQEGMSSDNTVSTERGAVSRKDDNGNIVHNEDDEGDWIDEDDDNDESDLDLVHYESLPIYHPNPDKRRRRWEAQWNSLVNATNSTMILMAAPANSKLLYSIRSRTLRRGSSLVKSTEMRRLRSIFKNLATQQKGQSSRNQPSHMSLVERFEHYSSSSSDTIENREEELKNTLGAALSTINALTNIYEGRDQRWGNEMNLRRDERERVDILLRQAFGFGLGGI
ncbi:hypothetical protein Clacol_008355 [Clathrus columnatus]|uniref:Uncharacterized protein n=1 Tax=Clathrus columnatus TaxID=1419009 RepID=A0AAV5AN43_9AGAM|nr:hypothetical protein Clacol_008355 [Clathrus columnatus]